eukprot:TRINITY_DN73656_c0_g1_i1.p1 TRINITY_DN73656_c0_g1~~TRINITY_DN73656_c0_g1_i1.p1  ORF type:complete len:159 (-),score=38.21 TRINITY_DN73656_c0_g1_i1:76-552(-)
MGCSSGKVDDQIATRAEVVKIHDRGQDGSTPRQKQESGAGMCSLDEIQLQDAPLDCRFDPEEDAMGGSNSMKEDPNSLSAELGKQQMQEDEKVAGFLKKVINDPRGLKGAVRNKRASDKEAAVVQSIKNCRIEQGTPMQVSTPGLNEDGDTSSMSLSQ